MRMILIMLALPLLSFGQSKYSNKIAIAEVALGGSAVVISIPVMVYGLANYTDGHEQSAIETPIVAAVVGLAGTIVMVEGALSIERKNRVALAPSATLTAFNRPVTGLTLTHTF